MGAMKTALELIISCCNRWHGKVVYFRGASEIPSRWTPGGTWGEWYMNRAHLEIPVWLQHFWANGDFRLGRYGRIHFRTANNRSQIWYFQKHNATSNHNMVQHHWARRTRMRTMSKVISHTISRRVVQFVSPCPSPPQPPPPPPPPRGTAIYFLYRGIPPGRVSFSGGSVFTRAQKKITAFSRRQGSKIYCTSLYLEQVRASLSWPNPLSKLLLSTPLPPGVTLGCCVWNEHKFVRVRAICPVKCGNMPNHCIKFISYGVM